jgi:hypothetical protein
MKLPLAYRQSSGRLVDATGAFVGSLVGPDFTDRATHDHGEQIAAACNAHAPALTALAGWIASASLLGAYVDPDTLDWAKARLKDNRVTPMQAAREVIALTAPR